MAWTFPVAEWNTTAILVTPGFYRLVAVARVPARCSPRCSSPTAARSPCGSSGRWRSWGSRRSPCTPSSTATRCTSQRADEAYLLGPGPAAESYLEDREDPRGRDAVRAPRRSTPATASWPRTPPSRRRARTRGSCSSARPRARSRRWARRPRARELMQAAGVPIVPGTTEPVARPGRRAQGHRQDEIGYPGGGQGGRRRRRQGLPRRARPRTSSRTRSRAPPARARSSSPTRRSTSSATCPTRATSRCRCWPTRHGNVIHLGERDCSVQRRHQKLIEESPAPAVDEALRAADRQDRHRRRRGRRATSARARSRGCSQDGEYFFLEMNTRVQVEHCVTEMTTGIDIVREGIRAAAGEPLSVTPGRRRAAAGTRSSAASTPRTRRKNFAPAPGRIGDVPRALRARACAWTPASAPAARSRRCTTRWSPSSSSGTPTASRRRGACCARSTSTRSRAEDADPVPPGAARHRAVGATRETCRDLVEDREWLKRSPSPRPSRRTSRRGQEEPKLEQDYTVEVSGRRFDVKVIGPSPAARRTAAAPPALGPAAKPQRREARGAPAVAAAATRWPRPSRAPCSRSRSSRAHTVEEGALIAVVEAMKMENEITAHKGGTVTRAADRRRRVRGHGRHARRHRVRGGLHRRDRRHATSPEDGRLHRPHASRRYGACRATAIVLRDRRHGHGEPDGRRPASSGDRRPRSLLLRLPRGASDGGGWALERDLVRRAPMRAAAGWARRSSPGLRARSRRAARVASS